MLVRAGAAQDPADKPGVATMVVVAARSGHDHAERRARLPTPSTSSAACWAPAPAPTSPSSTPSCCRTTSTRAAPAVRRHPPPGVQQTRSSIASASRCCRALKVSYQDPDYVANIVAERLIFGFHPYGRPANGTPESLAKMTRDDLVAFHKRGSRRTTLCWRWSATSPSRAPWPASSAPSAPGRGSDVPAIAQVDPPEPTRRVVVVDRPGAVQTEIRVGQLGIPRNNPDYMPLNLAVKILGGEGGNRLQGVLRSRPRPHLRRLGRHGRLSARRRDRRRDRHPHRDDGRGAEAHRRRVLSACSRSGRRGRALGGAGVPGRQLPADHRDADAIAMKVLNALFYGLDLKELADLPRAGHRGHLRRHPAGRARLPASRPAGDRAGRRRREVRRRSEEASASTTTSGAAADSRSDRGRLQARPRAAAPAQLAAVRDDARLDLVRRGVAATSTPARSPRELRRLEPDSRRRRLRRPAPRRGRRDALDDYRHYSVTGLVRGAAHAAAHVGALSPAGRARPRQRRPSVFVPIDFPDFNFRLGQAVHRLGIPVVYYISPQLWAWRPGRLETMKRFVDAGAADLPVRGSDLSRSRDPGRVRRPSAHRSARPAGRSRSGSSREIGCDPDASDARAAARQPAERAARHPRRPRRRGGADCARTMPRVQFVLARAPNLDDHLFAPPSTPRADGRAAHHRVRDRPTRCWPAPTS